MCWLETGSSPETQREGEEGRERKGGRGREGEAGREREGGGGGEGERKRGERGRVRQV